MKDSFSIVPLGGLVLSIPVRYHVFHADHHNAESSKADSSPGGGACSSAPLYRVSRSTRESERTRGLPGPEAERGSMSTGRTPMAARASADLSESLKGVTICRISWKLFRAARETSLFLLRAADWMWSSRISHALKKSPTDTQKNVWNKIMAVLTVACNASSSGVADSPPVEESDVLLPWIFLIKSWPRRRLYCTHRVLVHRSE